MEEEEEEGEKKREKGVKYRVPSVPLALSSLRDRAAPVDSTYSRISPRFWYDGVSRDLCKMVRSSLGSFSARSTLYLTRAQPWHSRAPSAPPPVFFLVACARRKVDLGTEGALRTLRTRFLYIPRAKERERASERTNKRLLFPTQMFRNSFILRNSCSDSDNETTACCTTKRLLTSPAPTVTSCPGSLSCISISQICVLRTNTSCLKEIGRAHV